MEIMRCTGRAGDTLTVQRAREGTALANIGAMPTVADRTALKALDTTLLTSAHVREAGKDGIFNFEAGDFSPAAEADPTEGVYVAANGIAPNIGIWVRHLPTNALDLDWFVTDSDDDYQTVFPRALALGKPIDLRDREYDVGGNTDNAVMLPAGTHIFGGLIRDALPTGGGPVDEPGRFRRLLHALDQDSIRLPGISFERNGTGAHGTAGNNAGTVYIRGGKGHLLDSLEAYGDVRCGRT